MRLRRRKTPAATVVAIVNGKPRPIWALRAGQLIVETEYDHDTQRIVLTVEDSDTKEPRIVENTVVVPRRGTP